jgi:tetratricopeptide (TPR) repeat protein
MPRPQTKPPGAPDLAELLWRAGAHHKRGELHEAETLYRDIIAVEPNHFDALHLCGVLMHQRGRPVDALALIVRALRANDRAAPAHSNHGIVLAALERYDEALASYQRALTLKPGYAEAFYNRGNALAALGRNDEALASFEQAVALRGDYRDALINRSQLLHRLGRSSEALPGLARAIALKSDAAVLALRGNINYAMGSYAAALADYERVIELRPQAAQMHNNRGNALRELGRHHDALESFARALALKPDYAKAFNNRGNALVELNRPAEALADYERALALKQDFADALVNRGNALRYLGRADEALASFNAAIALRPELAEAHWNKGLTCLSLGDFDNGWRGYEWRWRRGHTMPPRDFAQPQWRGEDIAGKTILLHAEQGFGDTIQFVRYAPLVAAKGATVILEAPDSLMPLLDGFDGVAATDAHGRALPPFDLHCPLMSLPLAFGTTLATIPENGPYLRVPAERLEKWRSRLAALTGKRVGLVWSGKPAHKNDRNRCIPLSLLTPLLSVTGVGFVSLQQDYREADRTALANYLQLLRLERELTDFADTAAVVAALDLVIAVDTAVAHLAGTMGKPVWILLSHVLDWRWLLERPDSPWYPSARLYRQPASGDWGSVIARLAQDLAAEAKG